MFFKKNLDHTKQKVEMFRTYRSSILVDLSIQESRKIIFVKILGLILNFCYVSIMIIVKIHNFESFWLVPILNSNEPLYSKNFTNKISLILQYLVLTLCSWTHGRKIDRANTVSTRTPRNQYINVQIVTWIFKVNSP